MAYDPKPVEEKWYADWKAKGYFHEEPDPARVPYCITIPPPNITGSLHMGHALNNTVLDAMTRWHRMRGFCALCLPGTDHAGIATQSVVERDLAREGLDRLQIGREQFVQRCWQWRQQYGARIYYQFEKLGCSYDWNRVRFTMDQSYVDAIMEEFRSWYERGLIYRGTRVVNWDVKLQSAVSDIEVEMVETAGQLYHFRYPLADGGGSVSIATTRPETMLGDTAVAANPADQRYQAFFGRTIRLPLTDRIIPFIADDFARPEFGTGAVKVTPAHDLEDFECGLRHNLPQIVVIGPDGRMTAAAGSEFAGLDRTEARGQVLARMKALGLLEKIEPYTIQTPVSERTGEIIEPLLSEQWFVNMKPLAAPAIQAVKQGRVRFFPERYEGIYLAWMERIRDWCISRQLWWGHRIPVWWAEDDRGRRHAFARNREEAVQALGTEECWQDEDVLDTWFSSALWPHATLGWPHATEDLAYFYPTNLLSTAQEILYLWVARMIMTGLDFVRRPAAATPDADGIALPDGQRAMVPFRHVYIHATVLDERGERMSKSKGNGVDPMDLIERYGADATRFSLAQQAGMNQDIRYSEHRTELAAAFCNKLWNASRFVLMNLDTDSTGALPPPEQRELPDRWILARLNQTIGTVDASLGRYELDDAMRALYAFLWSDFCDWYVEAAKPRLKAGPADRARVQNVLAHVLEATLRLMHPILPFITEEIWQQLPRLSRAGTAAGKPAESICLAAYPSAEAHPEDGAALAEMETVIEAVRALRNLRSEAGVAQAERPDAAWASSNETTRRALRENAQLIEFLARVQAFQEGQPEVGAAASPIRGGEVALKRAANAEQDRARLTRELEEADRQITRAQGLLNNPSFVERARPEVVEKERRNLAEWEARRISLKRMLEGLE